MSKPLGITNYETKDHSEYYIAVRKEYGYGIISIKQELVYDLLDSGAKWGVYVGILEYCEGVK